MDYAATKYKSARWQYIVLTAIIALSFFFHFWNLAKEGSSNQYYAAAAVSMLKNPASFFFGSLDSGLFVTVDKPPVGLWLQALSVGAFGQNSFGFIFPSALAGALCVLLVFLITKKVWGATVGVFAAGVMAATPILVAMSRTNNLDTLLLFFLLLASWVMLNAAGRQSLPRYILAMALVGAAFNIKMLEAFFVVPAFVLIYLVAGKGKPSKKVAHTAIAVCVLAAVSFSWALVVDSIPAAKRPYIGSSQKNSVMDLAFGYNGLTRLTGERGIGGGDGGFQSFGNRDGVQTRQGNGNPLFGMSGSGQPDGRAGGPGGAQESGQPGLLRLLSAQLSGLISWFLLPALAAVALSLWGILRWIFKKRSKDWTEYQKQKWLFILFWSACLVPMAVFFSYGGFIHRYYVVLLSPAAAILAACAAGWAWTSGHKKWMVPVLFGGALALQCTIAGSSVWNILLVPMLACGGLGTVLFILPHTDARVDGLLPAHKHTQTIAAILMAGALFIAPVAWSLTPITQALNATIPDAGPQASRELVRNNGGYNDLSRLEEYIVSHYNGERWALAVPSASQAAPIILDTGLPVMATGGFSGADQILTLDMLKEYAASGELKYFLVTGFGRGGSDISRWLQQNGKQAALDGYALYDLSGAKE